LSFMLFKDAELTAEFCRNMGKNIEEMGLWKQTVIVRPSHEETTTKLIQCVQ
jgi:hypothetical protein